MTPRHVLEKWIALFSVATETYIDLRRTKRPYIFNDETRREEDFPLRFRYPGAEVGQNKNAYDKGVSTLSPAEDTEHAKMWLLQ